MGSGDDNTGPSRRDILRRSALVGGSVMWMAPAVQTIAAPAYAGSPVPGDTGGNGAPSWVMVWFKCGDDYQVVKYNQQGQAEVCPATIQHASNDFPKNRGQVDTTSEPYVQITSTFSAYGPYTEPCPLANVSSSISSDGDLLITLSGSDCEIVDWFLHDGSCQQTGDDKFRWQGDTDTGQVAFVYAGGGIWEFQKCKP